MLSAELLRRGVEAARAGRNVEAREIFMQVVDADPRNEMAWMSLSGLMDSLEDRIIACENVLTINPENHKTQLYLEELKQKRDALNAKAMKAIQHHEVKQPDNHSRKESHPRDPLRMAEYLEQDGKYEKALEIYRVEAAKAQDVQVFDQIYKRMMRIEKMVDEKIKYVSPRSSIFRLAFTWPLLYMSLALIQIGLNPMKHLTSYLWFAFPWVVLGSLLIAVSEVRSRHVIWRRVFLDHGDGSIIARTIVSATGWIMILVPFALILLDSLNRLSVFQIPPRLF